MYLASSNLELLPLFSESMTDLVWVDESCYDGLRMEKEKLKEKLIG